MVEQRIAADIEAGNYPATEWRRREWVRGRADRELHQQPESRSSLASRRRELRAAEQRIASIKVQLRVGSDDGMCAHHKTADHRLGVIPRQRIRGIMLRQLRLRGGFL